MKVDVLGIKVNAETKAEILKDIKFRLYNGQSTFIVTPYSESLVSAQKDLEFRRILNSADISLPDGIGTLWAAHFLKSKTKNQKLKFWNFVTSLLAIIFNPKNIRDPIPEKISGSEFVWDLAQLAAENNRSIFLLGGFGDTPVLAAAALKKKFPNLKIAGTYSPKKEDVIARSGGAAKQSQEQITDLIKKTNPDFLFVALGPVRQEKWIAENLPNLPVKLAIGLGGTFDYLAGERPYRGHFWAVRGLEWLWRLLTQPWRAGRILRGIFGLIYYCLKN